MSTDNAGSLRRRMAARVPHEARIAELHAEGRLLLAGSCPAADSEHGAGRAGFIGGVIVARFENLRAAQDWSDADPYWEIGVYQSVDVRPLHIALP